MTPQQKAGRVIYYVERDGLIKIGCSSQPYGRARALGGALLATEPGGFEREGVRHIQFKHLSAGGEWFTIAPDLVDHIKSLGQPDLGGLYMRSPSPVYLEAVAS